MSNKEEFKIDQEYEVIERMIDCDSASDIKGFAWDWDNIKNTTDKYIETAMRIKTFKYLRLDNIGDCL